MHDLLVIVRLNPSCPNRMNVVLTNFLQASQHHPVRASVINLTLLYLRAVGFEFRSPAMQAVVTLP